MVFTSKEKAQKMFPDLRILEYKEGDIEAPLIVDIPIKLKDIPISTIKNIIADYEKATSHNDDVKVIVHNLKIIEDNGVIADVTIKDPIEGTNTRYNQCHYDLYFILRQYARLQAQGSETHSQENDNLEDDVYNEMGMSI